MRLRVEEALERREFSPAASELDEALWDNCAVSLVPRRAPHPPTRTQTQRVTASAMVRVQFLTMVAVLVVFSISGTMFLSLSHEPPTTADSAATHTHTLTLQPPPPIRPRPVVFNDTWLLEYRKLHRAIMSRPPPQKRPMLVFRCPGACGGVGDRIMGLTNTFAMAVLTDRAFMIEQNDADFVRPTFGLTDVVAHRTRTADTSM